MYAHVANKRELDHLLVDRAAQDMNLPETPDPDRWQEQLKDAMREMLRVMRANPGVARAAMAQVPLGERALLSTERMLGILKAGNLPDQAAAWAVDLIPLYVTATAFEENVKGAATWSQEDIEGFAAELRGFFESLPADRFPLTAALAGALTAGSSGDERFEFGITVITAGLASLADGQLTADRGLLRVGPCCSRMHMVNLRIVNKTTTWPSECASRREAARSRNA